MGFTSKIIYKALETGFIPDRITKLWMNYLCQRTIKNAKLDNIEARNSVFRQIRSDLLNGSEIRKYYFTERNSIDFPLTFYDYFLGKNLSLTCGYFSTGAEDLNEAEDTALWLASEHARIREGMSILEIGCGAGAFSFWLANKYPSCKITALTPSPKMLSNLRKKAQELDINNINFISQEIKDFTDADKFDRVICLERFDLLASLGNWEKRVKKLLNKDGMFFMTARVHSSTAFYEDSTGFDNMPGNNVIEDVIIPSVKSLMLTTPDLHLVDMWEISGLHYKQTADKWFRKFTFNKEPILRALEKAYGSDKAHSWYNKMRLYILSLYERYGYNHGQEWITAQYLYSPSK